MREINLSLSEKFIMASGILLNIFGYFLTTRENPIKIARVCWRKKIRRLDYLLNLIEKESKVPKNIIEKYMKVICYRHLLKFAYRRKGLYNPKEFKRLREKYPLDWKLILTPKKLSCSI